MSQFRIFKTGRLLVLANEELAGADRGAFCVT